MSASRFASAFLLALVLTPLAHAHFLWIETEPGSKSIVVKAGFGEAGAWESEYAENIADTKYSFATTGGEVAELPLEWSDDTEAYVGRIDDSKAPLAIHGVCVWGLFGRGGPTESLVYYYPKAVVGNSADWSKLKPASACRVEIVPARDGNRLSLTVLSEGKPLAKTKVKIYDAEGTKTELTTDDKGIVEAELSKPGRYSMTVVERVAKSGEFKGKKYDGEMHCASLTLTIE